MIFPIACSSPFPSYIFRLFTSRKCIDAYEMTIVVPPLTIVYTTGWFGQTKFHEPLILHARDCPIPDGYTVLNDETNTTDIDEEALPWCTLTSSKDDIHDAAALIFHAMDVPPKGLPDHISNQPWILESLETPYSSPYRSDPDGELMENFDYLASYHLNSSFWFTYFSPSIMDVVNRPLPKDFIKTKTKSAPVLWIARNCRATNGREKYIKKLMEYVDVHSYGPCLNNKPFPSDKSRLNLMSEYKFYLAIENANCEDYVTEKLFDTLSQSAVPILDGPPSYEGFLPTQRSAIFMDAYPDPKDLADYINFLDKNDTAYLEYLSFRRDALDKSIKDRLDQKFIDNWSDTMAFNEKSSYCSVCRGVLPWWAYKNDPTKRQSNETFQEKKDVFVVDNTCAKRGKWDYIDNGPPYHPDWTPRSSDEFTRPNFYVNSTVVTVNPSNIDINNHSLYFVYSIFIILVFLFMAFLHRKSKRYHNKSSHLIYSPLQEQQPSHHAPTQVATTVV